MICATFAPASTTSPNQPSQPTAKPLPTNQPSDGLHRHQRRAWPFRTATRPGRRVVARRHRRHPAAGLLLLPRLLPPAFQPPPVRRRAAFRRTDDRSLGHLFLRAQDEQRRHRHAGHLYLPGNDDVTGTAGVPQTLRAAPLAAWLTGNRGRLFPGAQFRFQRRRNGRFGLRPALRAHLFVPQSGGENGDRQGGRLGGDDLPDSAGDAVAVAGLGAV